MTLCDWIEKKGNKKAAELLGVDPSTISLWKAGTVKPSVKNMKKIRDVTDSKVSYKSMIETKGGGNGT